jgi:hypothetical protein
LVLAWLYDLAGAVGLPGPPGAVGGRSMRGVSDG